MWLSLGLIIIPITGIIFGIALKIVVNKILHLSLTIGQAISIQLVTSFSCWLFMILIIFGSQFTGSNAIWQTINGISAIFITGVCYSKLIKSDENETIGLSHGIKLSAIMSAIAFALIIPINLIRA